MWQGCSGALLVAGVLWVLEVFTPGCSAQAPIRLTVDTREAAKKIYHVRMTLPVGPGPLTLFFVKWIPGEHSPSGQIVNLVGLRMSAGGKPIEWRRDDVDMFAFHCNVGGGVKELDVSFDMLSPTEAFDFQGGVSATANVAIVNWNQMLLYPAGQKTDDLTFQPSLILPANWRYGTALTAAESSEAKMRFEPVTLTKLVDSPVILGRYYRRVELTPREKPDHTLEIVGDSAAALNLSPVTIEHLRRLVREGQRLFQSHHYAHYSFLITLSDRVAHIAQEHHESSDNRFDERTYLDADREKLQGDVLPHEFAHSWNGKFRRPVGLLTRDFQEPMRGEMLWVYEGLTQYLGGILAARSGAWTQEEYRENLALTVADMEHHAGRTWRNLEDTAVAAHLLYFAPEEWAARRRGTDFYSEGQLLWLEVDARIRELTRGQKSLDGFCGLFFGGESGPPSEESYTFDQLVAALGKIAAQDWGTFFREKLTSHSAQAPTDGIESSGWRVVYTDQMPEMLRAKETIQQRMELGYSIGISLQTAPGEHFGRIIDVVPGSAAEKAGFAPGMKLIAVNGRKWSPDLLRAALREAKTDTKPIELLVENDEEFANYGLDYHGGARFPHLERIEGKEDGLAAILRPLTH